MAARKPAHDDDDDQPETTTPRDEQPGERQAIWIVTRMEEIQEDQDMKLDAQNVLSAMSSGAQKYLAYLLREGPRSHADAARHFGAKVSAVEKAAADVVAALKQVVDDR